MGLVVLLGLFFLGTMFVFVIVAMSSGKGESGSLSDWMDIVKFVGGLTLLGGVLALFFAFNG